MKTLVFKIFLMLLVSVSLKAEGIGLSFGIGLPYVSQPQLDYRMSKTIGFSVASNSLTLDAGTASVSLALTEAMVNYYPFEGSFFIGAGLGSQTFEVTATDATTSTTASAEATSSTTVIKTGWAWGSDDGGFWFGMDAAYILPSGGDVTITGTAVDGQTAYDDAEEQGEKFAESAYVNFTFFRLGYMF